ncbi:MAG: rod shape-determining protein RodA [Actinomycetes bacterium]
MTYSSTDFYSRRGVVDRALDRDSTLRRLDWVLMGSVLTLLFIGTLLVWSATKQKQLDAGGDPQTYLKKHLINIIIGLALAALTTLLDYRMLRAYAPLIYGASVLGLLAVLSPLGSTINGAHSWIVLPAGFSVQPSEFAKVAIVVGVSVLLSERRDGESAPIRSDLLLALGFAAIPVVLIMLQPDLGTTMVIAFIILGMLAVAGVETKFIAALLGIAAVGAVLAIKVGVLSTYQINRFAAFANPSLDPRGVGYNTGQARIAIGQGSWFGQGLFRGTQTNGRFVPEQQTDFVFTVAGEELGLVGAGVIIILIGIILWRTIRIARRAEDLYGVLVATGIACWFTFQAFENIGMTLGITPVTGLPLPFVSYGGSSMFANMMAIGLLQNVHLKRYV